MTRSPAEWDAALRDALDRPPRHVLTPTQVLMAIAGELDAARMDRASEAMLLGLAWLEAGS